MSSDQLIKHLTIGANFAVLVGLIFVGVEMRTNRAAAQAQMADGIAEGYLEINMAVVSDPALACVWTVGLEAPERLSDMQAGQFSMLMSGVFNQYMRVHSLYETGLVKEEIWSHPASTASWLITTPGGQLFFQSNALPDDFVDAVAPHKPIAQGFMLERELPSECP